MTLRNCEQRTLFHYHVSQGIAQSVVFLIELERGRGVTCARQLKRGQYVLLWCGAVINLLLGSSVGRFRRMTVADLHSRPAVLEDPRPVRASCEGFGNAARPCSKGRIPASD